MKASKRYTQPLLYGMASVIASLGFVASSGVPIVEKTQSDTISRSMAYARDWREIRPEMTLDDVQAFLNVKMKKYSVETRTALAVRIVQLGHELSFDPAFILSVIQTESHFRNTIVSSAGAIGMMQLLPSTARFIANKREITDYRGAADLRNPMVNVTLGAHYLSYLREIFPNSRQMMMAYNAGPAQAQKIISRTGKPRRGGPISRYVASVHMATDQIADEARWLRVMEVSKLGLASCPILGEEWESPRI